MDAQAERPCRAQRAAQGKRRRKFEARQRRALARERQAEVAARIRELLEALGVSGFE